MEKKISFSFNKISKKPNILQNKLVRKDDVNKIELIKGLEGHSIQLVKEKVEEAPLVIPLKDNRKTSAALLSLKTRQAVLNGEEVPTQKEDDLPAIKSDNEARNDDDNIEKRAAKELLAEVSKNQNLDEAVSTLVLPVKTEDLPLDGAKESNIDDYESIPISQFGFAMLRGMGWKDEQKKKAASIDDGIMVRPKGMGLGADKALKPKALLIAPEANEVLEIKKGACIRVLGGKHKDLYGQIEGLDDYAGRVIVKMALGGTKESFNEFLVQVVCKKEYAQYSKCINSAKYDEYKRKENAQGQIIIKKEDPEERRDVERERNYKESNHDRKYDRSRTSPHRNGSDLHSRSEKSARRSRSREKRSDNHSSSTSNKKYTDRVSPSRDRHKSSDSVSSDSSSHRSKHRKSSKKKKSKKSKDKSHDRRASVSSADEDRRYKKKTKKSKRGRSRSKCRR